MKRRNLLPYNIYIAMLIGNKTNTCRLHNFYFVFILRAGKFVLLSFPSEAYITTCVYCSFWQKKKKKRTLTLSLPVLYSPDTPILPQILLIFVISAPRPTENILEYSYFAYMNIKIQLSTFIKKVMFHDYFETRS